jgi:DNA-binding Lrp family transcriptional regulator
MPGIVPDMATKQRPTLDGADHSIIRELQRDGRMSVAQLARAINLSPSATADRLRRLTDDGVIVGYTPTVDPEALGYTVTAFVRLAYLSGNYKPFHDLVAATPVPSREETSLLPRISEEEIYPRSVWSRSTLETVDDPFHDELASVHITAHTKCDFGNVDRAEDHHQILGS